jgi:ATP-dependent RNA helicase DDX5/DBP2
LIFYYVCLSISANSNFFPLIIFFFLDVSDIKYVMNYDYPNNSEDYVHRIGRTGRRDNIGVSYTFFTPTNGPKAKDLIKVLEEAKQTIPEELQRLANTSGGGGSGGRGRGRPPMKRDAGGYGGGGGYGGSPTKRTRYDGGAASSWGGQTRSSGGFGTGGGGRW